jgi:hypothetical protein
MPVADWLLRLVPALFLYIFLKNMLLTWNFQSIAYLIVFGISIFAILLIIGGFSKQHTLTMVSGLMIMVLSILLIFLDFKKSDSVIFGMAFFAIGFYFLASGNRMPQKTK